VDPAEVISSPIVGQVPVSPFHRTYAYTWLASSGSLSWDAPLCSIDEWVFMENGESRDGGGKALD